MRPVRSAKSGPLRRPGTGRPRPDMMQDLLHSGGVPKSEARVLFTATTSSQSLAAHRERAAASSQFLPLIGEKHLSRQRQYRPVLSKQPQAASNSVPSQSGTENALATSHWLALGVIAGGATVQLRWMSNTKLMASRVFVKHEERILSQFSPKRPLAFSREGERRHELHTRIGRRPSSRETNSIGWSGLRPSGRALSAQLPSRPQERQRAQTRERQ